MNGHIADDKRPSIEHCKAFWAPGALLAYPPHAPSCLVAQWQCPAWLETRGGVASPTAEEVPGPQAEGFGDEEPEADHGATDLVGEELSHATFEARGVARCGCGPLLGAMGCNRGLRLRMRAMQLFFAGQSLP
jgi:hypothetical protein